ncbi:N-acetylmuramoyl-L-alanine amidase domain-containing protein [Glomus cerebriforme]|uniref:N-acetylmuramoyl-L-alanine amidase domain-containing protein n=1 Tax=Glomus cerebriforme TaxID=658196 RepID=A0A397SHX3_9GLOM|nr:N-acetylmuramoyl-L-alanine amidase domain-containing protein [Glomus cerebriforme]
MARQIMNKDAKDAKGIFYINDEPYYVPFPVIDYKNEERGYSFVTNWEENYGIRSDPSGNSINGIVLHWDVCTSARDCFLTLCQRGISGHILIDGDGTVYQTLDLVKLAYHAKGWNSYSIGIFLQNPVGKLKDDQNRDYYESREPGRNKPYTHLDFTDEQKKIIIKVCEALCKIFPNIPRILPPLSNDGLITTATLPVKDRVGILANYNVQSGTLGPGDSLWVEFYRAKFPIRDA